MDKYPEEKARIARSRLRPAKNCWNCKHVEIDPKNYRNIIQYCPELELVVNTSDICDLYTPGEQVIEYNRRKDEKNGTRHG